MPKENTHLWFARRLREGMPASEEGCLVGKIVRDEPLLFSLGAIIPDAFFYHPRSRGRRLAGIFHGSDPTMRDDIFSRAVHQSGDDPTGRSKAFVLGYLSHVALDQAMHPVVNALSGKRPGQASTRASIALHRLVETALDQQINPSCRYPRIIRPELGRRVDVLHRLASEAGLRPGDIHAALRNQFVVNQMVQGRIAHALLGMLHYPSVLDLSVLLNLSYAQLARESGFLRTALTDTKQDERAQFWTGYHAVNWMRLTLRAEQRALDLFRLCTAYWDGQIGQSELQQGLPRKPCN
ncbi:zinc dependent phospholipase C family protein [Desulfonatronum thioautotrophicum]|uniref:zinc dependent phospholipase C family protein n=1 Tax=Desulfonatronum thioautotrophicum TaxID=617001 RepID=UPI0005EBC068|nr:zinc dependent phospholipase C family protein [Desulfonatronum thioautotrophicum]